MGFFDLIAIAGYLLIVSFVGWRAGRGEDSEGFLLGGRNLEAFSAACTIAATKVGAGLLLTFTALVYEFGAGAIWLFVGFVFGYAIFFFFARKLKRIGDSQQLLTMPDYYRYCFDRNTARLVSAVLVLNLFGWLVVTFIGGAKILSSYTEVPYSVSTVIVAGVIALYLLSGGFLAVVRTDVVQLFGIGSLLILLLVVLSNSSGAWREDLSIFTLPIGKTASFFVTGVLVPLASAEMWQRVYAVKDEKTLAKSLIIASLMYIVLGVALLAITLCIKDALPNLTSDIALVSGLHQLLPVGLSGLAVVVFYSAIMSTSDTLLFTAAASIANDLCQDFNRGDFYDQEREIEQRETTVRLMKISMLVLCVLAVIFAIVFADIVDTTFFFLAITLSLGAVVLLHWIFPKLRSGGFFWGVALPLIAICTASIVQGVGLYLIGLALSAAILGVSLGHILSGSQADLKQ